MGGRGEAIQATPNIRRWTRWFNPNRVVCLGAKEVAKLLHSPVLCFQGEEKLTKSLWRQAGCVQHLVKNPGSVGGQGEGEVLALKVDEGGKSV